MNSKSTIAVSMYCCVSVQISALYADMITGKISLMPQDERSAICHMILHFKVVRRTGSHVANASLNGLAHLIILCVKANRATTSYQTSY